MSAPTLDAVTRAAEHKRAATANYRAAILAARADGATLQAIADAAGKTRQNVHKLLRRHERTDES